VLKVPARELPIPTLISPEAQAVMAMPGFGEQTYPTLDDKQGWREWVVRMDAMMLAMLEAKASQVNADVSELNVDGVRVYDIRPHTSPIDNNAIYLDIHGGGFVACAGNCCRALARMVAGDLNMHVWSVDYRVPPDHPYPAPLDDCIGVYRALRRQHAAKNIVVGGGSAGANLAAALVLRARAEGLPLPAGVIMQTPALDLTRSTDSWTVNNGVDATLVGDMGSMTMLYVGEHDPQDPYVSPLFGDFRKGFSPSFLSAGTRDRLLSCAALMHAKLRAADIYAELHIVEAASHGGFFGAPEDQHVYREMQKFIRRVVPAPSAS
jgi:acetyl esterase/lipase